MSRQDDDRLMRCPACSHSIRILGYFKENPQLPVESAYERGKEKYRRKRLNLTAEKYRVTLLDFLEKNVKVECNHCHSRWIGLASRHCPWFICPETCNKKDIPYRVLSRMFKNYHVKIVRR
ncbi:MAG: hypothetical protein KGH64_03265 [Candidatus Micrarchaeota archaeon]|nr:hypothetical protein [Candidatus Micrarchaeota archaeon]MDE1859193.1 hypothetical protein [Candidatus Micrarchaeota archaeon]